MKQQSQRNNARSAATRLLDRVPKNAYRSLGDEKCKHKQQLITSAKSRALKVLRPSAGRYQRLPALSRHRPRPEKSALGRRRGQSLLVLRPRLPRRLRPAGIYWKRLARLPRKRLRELPRLRAAELYREPRAVSSSG